jgi:hypothetical protein
MLFSESVVSLFWAVIKERRKSGKYTLQSVADAAGVDKAKVSKDFSGTPNWKSNTIVDYAGALGVDLEIRARDRTTGAIITPSGPIESTMVLTGSGVQTAGSTCAQAESGARLIEVERHPGSVLEVRAAVG